MRDYLFAASALAFGGSIALWANSRRTVWEIESLALLQVSAILLVGACVVRTIERASRKIESLLESQHSPPQPQSQWLPVAPADVEAEPLDDEGKAKAMLAQATQLTDAGDWGQAVVVLREVVREYPLTGAAQRAAKLLQKYGGA